MTSHWRPHLSQFKILLFDNKATIDFYDYAHWRLQQKYQTVS